MRICSSAALGVVAVGYLPHVIAVGPHVSVTCAGYLHEDEYSSGSRFVLLGFAGPAAERDQAARRSLLLARWPS